MRVLSFHGGIERLRGDLQVVAVHGSAWHLQAPGGWILTVSSAAYDGPLGLRVPKTDLQGAAISLGAPAHLSEERLVVDQIELDLDGADVWSPRLSGDGMDWEALERDLRSLRRLRKERAPVFAGMELDRGTEELRTALGCRRSADIERAVFQLVGLGPGLTPSGDDVLCGVLMAFYVWATRSRAGGARTEASPTFPVSPIAAATSVAASSAGPAPHLQPCLDFTDNLQAREMGASSPRGAPDRISNVLPLLRSNVRSNVHRTTALSRTLLRCAVGDGPGGVPVAVQPLLDVLWSLGTPGGVRGLDALLAIGHSSGRDMLRGVILAASIALEWEDDDDPALVRAREHVPRLGQAHASLRGAG